MVSNKLKKKTLQINYWMYNCINRSPNSTRDDFYNMTRAIKYVVDLKPTHILIMGDFNLREIDWNNEETSVGEDHLATIFLESVRNTYLH